jgi:endonuclease G
MSPAGDNTQNEKIMSESFLLSNMVPQIANNNRGIWKQLETKVRTYVASTNDLYVASGPIYDAGYKTIGPNKVGVPTRLYKIVIDTKNNKASAYIFPNTALPVADMEKFKVTIVDVEKATGINFNPKLPANSGVETKKDW